MATISDIRMELADTSVEFPILSDAEYQYFLTKNSDNLARTAVDCARAILMKLSMRSDSSTDIFSMKHSSASRSYIEALKLYLTNPSLNPINQNTQIYFGGTSLSDMSANDYNTDNNIVLQPTASGSNLPTNFFDN